MKTYLDEYMSKAVSADEAVKVVKSSDLVHYHEFVMVSKVLDEALAKRKDELNDVAIRVVCSIFAPQTITSDPGGTHFRLHDTFYGVSSRTLADKDFPVYFLPMVYSEIGGFYDRGYIPIDVLMLKVSPMDKHGYFNIGTSNSGQANFRRVAKKIIVEVNESVPVCLGGCEESIHISDIDFVVEGPSQPLFPLPKVPATDVDKKIAELIMSEIEDGCCIQLGIGGMPNTIGEMIAESDLKNLGVHSEMFCDAMMMMYEAGRINGKNKQIDRGKMVYTFAMGSSELYEFLDKNPACASYPCDYTNDPNVIKLNDKMISINNCLQVDLFGQVCSESAGIRQISGTGGQYDYLMGAYNSKGGKSFLCMSSTTTSKNGELISRITPLTPEGQIVTVPRSLPHNVVTEYGIVRLKGLTTWERAEAIISIAHPKFRDELVNAANKFGIWRKSNKLD